MKSVFLVLCFIGATLAFEECSSGSECGKDRCCLFNKVCFPKLPKYAPCNTKSAQKCGCKDGLSCKVTRELTIAGNLIQIKQCMPANEDIKVEKLTNQDVQETLQPGSTNPAPNPAGRFYPGKKCQNASDCFWPNTCCLFESRCGFKLPKYFTCYFTSKHKCDCMNGYVCKTTTTVMLPVVGTPFPIKQCVPTSDA
ncbi:uncharacterized protein LOC116295612 [Actinia tenebrosa]|uniref:Uncharacterized protein LOC116295612 n=1 Tax=Actinia tenebrosa TaxID=6105 RepID=A0A6P8I3E8_ACTTE|nr:uncharacterized protein LOC116295612 [Actinia tenebrosa]